MEPQFRFCTSSDGVRIAYAIYGSGPPLIVVCGFTRSMEAYFSLPESRAFLDALAAHTRLVIFDRRGTGASTRDVVEISGDADARDIAAVADAARLIEFALFSDRTFAPCARYSVEHPERVRHLVLWTPIYDRNQFLEWARLCRDDWSLARRVLASRLFPDGPVSLQRAHSQGLKETATADVAARHLEAQAGEEVVLLLPRVTAPTLVLQRETGLRQNAMRVASLLPNGQLRLVPGTSTVPYPGHEPIVKAILEFMGLDEIASAHLPQGTAIILFTDIVDSTALTERLGDTAFRTASRTLDEAMRAAMRDAGGTPVDGKVLGDGVMGVFASASQAIAAARRCLELSAETELQLHVGLHAGDVIREKDNVYGGAVNIASRICGLSAPGEILVSDIVRGLARTSAGVVFEDRGEHELKGVADAQRVYAVRKSGA